MMRVHIVLFMIGALVGRPSFAQNDDIPRRTFHIKKLHKDIAPMVTTTKKTGSPTKSAALVNTSSCYVTIGGRDSGSIPLAELQSATELYLEGCADNATIMSFDLRIGHSGTFMDKHSNSGIFTAEMNSIINQLSRGDMITAHNVICKTADGKVHAIKGLTLKVTGTGKPKELNQIEL